jgi:hypothetical protein
MWADLTPLLAKLPRTPAEGSINGTHGKRVASAGGEWTAVLADLERYRKYSDDWDGQGAKGIPREVIESAMALAAVLNTRDVIPPHCVLPGFEGTVGFEWDMTDSGSITLEITGHWTAELQRYVPGKSLERMMIAEPSTA